MMMMMMKLVWLKTAKVSCHEIIQDAENAKVSCLETFLFYSSSITIHKQVKVTKLE